MKKTNVLSIVGALLISSVCSLYLCPVFPRSVLAASKKPGSVSHPPAAQWRYYGNHATNDHYSDLTQITKDNVHQLRTAWTFDTHEVGGLQTTPLVIGRILYGITPTQKVFALDATNGKEMWTFDSGIKGTQPDRGLSWWSNGKEQRVFVGIMNFLYALDPSTGKPVASFGENGRIDLRNGLRDDPASVSIALTSPGMIYKDLIIVGGRNPETHPAAPGDIRAYDCRTGALRWSFHTIPHPGESGYESWSPDSWQTAGAANNWSGMALDEKRGIIYVPTGSAVDDFFGGDRLGNNLYANTLLALDAETGKRLWHFQGVHHDIWDRDFPSAPVLLSVVHNGKKIDAVAQTTKQGYLYLFDRVTGQPLFPIKEQAYPPSNIPGEQASPTQPKPVLPEPYARQLLTEQMLTNRTSEAHQYALEQFRRFRSEGLFVPFSADKQTVVFPGFDGGAEWGGPAVDTKAGIIYVNSNEMAWTGGLTNRPAGGPGESAYQYLCASCHGDRREGSPPAFPSLIGVDKRLSDEQIKNTIRQGKGRMPAFPMMTNDTYMSALLEYLKTSEIAGSTSRSSQGDKREMSSAANSQESGSTDVQGAKTYESTCAMCHGKNREGNPPSFPALRGVGTRKSKEEVTTIIHGGKGAMPAFANIQGAELSGLLRYLGFGETNAAKGTAFRFTGYRKFLDQDGYPAISPPWGTLNAIDLNTGKYVWKIPLGEYPELSAQGMKDTGSENYGGPIVTAGGVLFIGATVYDKKFRAFDSHSGKLLWQTSLPFSGNATPITYMIDGKQYIVIAAGGGKDVKSPTGGVYVAFVLP